MQQDFRNKFKDFKSENVELSSNHEDKFQQLLMQELHKEQPKKQTWKWMSVAASIVLLVSLGIQFYTTTPDIGEIKNNTKDSKSTPETISLGSISPEFKTIETYYTNSINLEISQLELNDENKEIVDSYLTKIAELTLEYKSLNQELTKNGVNDTTIDALIRNLQLRLQLLQRLKKQLKQLKDLNTTQNETQVI